MRFREELAQLAKEFRLFMDHETCDKEFYTKKGKVLEILQLLYGENSREFRVTKLTSSPQTIVKILQHITGRSNDMFYSLSTNNTVAVAK